MEAPLPFKPTPKPTTSTSVAPSNVLDTPIRLACNREFDFKPTGGEARPLETSGTRERKAAASDPPAPASDRRNVRCPLCFKAWVSAGSTTPKTCDDCRVRQIIDFVPPADRARAKEILRRGNDNDVLVSSMNFNITRYDIRTLKPRTWLNDEVINFFFALLLERDKAKRLQDPDYRPCHFFNSFFMAKLIGVTGKYNYENVRRWTQQFDIFSYDKIFMPVNFTKEHWCLAVIYVQKKVIQYYDSMGGDGKCWRDALLKYLQDEWKDKKGGEMDMTGWTSVPSQRDVPQQNNGSDCGAFTTCSAYLMSEGLPLKFTGDHIRQFRLRMVLSIVNSELYTRYQKDGIYREDTPVVEPVVERLAVRARRGAA